VIPWFVDHKIVRTCYEGGRKSANRNWQWIKIDDIQFGWYMPGKCTTDALFIVSQLHEKYRAKDKKV